MNMTLKPAFGLSGSALKVIAMISMVIDHVALYLMEQGTLLYETMRCIGRIAFPVFAFLIAEGFIHTRNRYRYFFLLKFLYLQNCTSGTPHPAAKRALVCQNFSAFPLEKYGKGHGQLYYIRVVFPFPQQKAENLGIFPVFFIYAHACACKMWVFRYNKKGPGMCRAPIKP